MNVDLNHLTLVQIILTLFALTALDWLAGVGQAIKDHTFTLDRIAEFLATHVLSRVIPLSFAAALGMGVGTLIPPIPAVWGIFLVGAAAYLVETLASIAGHLGANTDLNRPTSGAATNENVTP